MENSAVNLGSVDSSSDLHSIDDSIPSLLSQKVLLRNQLRQQQQQQQQQPQRDSKNSRILRPVSLDSLLTDKSLNFAQKERIAEAILKEQTEDLDLAAKSRIHKPEVDARSHAVAHLQRHAYQPKLLGVVSKSAPLLPAAGKDRNRHRDAVGHGPSEYRWGPKAVPSVPLHVPHTNNRTSAETEFSDEYLTRAEVIAENKRELVKKSVEQVKNLRTIIQEYNTEYTETRRREISYQRNINAFRQKIFDHLKERNDPQMSAIMRSLQDHVIQSFIETYKGNVMSIDAVLERIGVTLTPTFSNGEIPYRHPEETATVSSPTEGMTSLPLPQSQSQSQPVAIKKLSKLNKSYSRAPALSTLSAEERGTREGRGNGNGRQQQQIRVHHREVISRGAGFRSPNQRALLGNQPFSGEPPRGMRVSAYLQSPSPTREWLESGDEGWNDKDNTEPQQHHQRYTTPPAPHAPHAQAKGIEDSLSLDSLSVPHKYTTLPPPTSTAAASTLSFQRPPRSSEGGRSSKWVLAAANQDLTSASVPRHDMSKSNDKGSKGKTGRLLPSSSSSSRHPLSTTNYGEGLYAISSYKNVLDQTYLDHL